MVTRVVMPRLSLTMKEGTVGKWYKREGDAVERGEPIVEIISEKATYDLEAPASGILRKILVGEGADAPVDAVLAFIAAPDEKFSEAEIAAEAQRAIEEAKGKILASPAAKRLAREYGVDLSLVRGSRPEGRIVEEDVRRFIGESRGFLPRVKEVIPLSGFRRTSAERVTMSAKTAPHSTIMMEVDVSRAAELHRKLQVSYTAILVKAVAEALLEHPLLNSTFDGNQIKIFEDVNVGVAVATEHGLVVPVIKNADGKSLREIDEALNGMAERARRGKLAKEEVTGGTFTITNLGMYGVEFFTPIINPPEAAILGAGKVTEKPVVVDGKIEVKPLMMLSLSFDHRIVDGAPAAEFLSKVKEKIEKLEMEG
ncbi:MAG: dihydrolipoamide acetyltransferase family protein [Candidatus Bathyarchaeia archaeon]